MTHNLTIRLATPADAEILARIHIDSWRVAYRELVPDSYLAQLDYQKRVDRLRDSLQQHQEETYIAEKDGEVMGFLTIGPCRDDDLDDKIGEIWGIYLSTAHWRQGIGTSLCHFAEEKLSSRGHCETILWVFEGNARARRFYEAMGFEADGASKVLNVGSPATAIRYRKPLHKST